jgi:hypothetical protein
VSHFSPPPPLQLSGPLKPLSAHNFNASHCRPGHWSATTCRAPATSTRDPLVRSFFVAVACARANLTSRREILAASLFRSNRFDSPVPPLARASAPGQLATGSRAPRPSSSRCRHGHNSHRRIVRFDRRNQLLNRPASAATWNPPARIKGRANFRSALSLALNPHLFHEQKNKLPS